MTNFAEDLQVGAKYDLGSYFVSRSELVTFAEKWDPQGFHIDTEVAVGGQFGDVIASGAHTLAILQRLSVLEVEKDWAIIAGVQLRSVRFSSPLFPDTTVHGRLRVEDVVLDPARGRGLVTSRSQIRTADKVIMQLISDAYVHMRRR